MFSSHDYHALQRQRLRQIEALRFRSRLLSAHDKALIQMVFEQGGTFDQIARLTGQNPSTISRRFKSLLQKLISKEVVLLLQKQYEIDDTDIRIVQDYFLQGLSHQAIANKFNISLYRVRKILRTLRSIAYQSDTSPSVGINIHKSNAIERK